MFGLFRFHVGCAERLSLWYLLQRSLESRSCRLFEIHVVLKQKGGFAKCCWVLMFFIVLGSVLKTVMGWVA